MSKQSKTRRSPTFEAPEGSRGTGYTSIGVSLPYFEGSSATARRPKNIAGPKVSEELSMNTIESRALISAIDSGDRAAVLGLLRVGANVNTTEGPLSIPPLIRAIRLGNEAIVQLLLDWGAKVTRDHGWNETALHVAAGKGHTEVVRMLLQSGADVNAIDNNGEMPLHFAAGQGHHETVKMLLLEGADLSAQNVRGETALHLAAEQDHYVTVRLLLRNAADITAQDIQGRTPLHLAAEQGRSEGVRLLLQNSADITVQDIQGRTPLHLTAEQGCYETVELLLQNSADITAQDIQGRTPLHLAAEQGRYETVELLLQNSADTTAQDIQGRTPLHLTAEQGHSEEMQLLLQNSADITAQDIQGRTPLHLTAEQGHSWAVRLLLQNSADTTAQDIQGRTPLHLAAEQGYSEAVRLLLQNSADITAQDIQGRTPLHLAAEKGYSGAMRLLLQNSADTTAQDIQGRTPLHLTAEQGHSEGVWLLLHNSADITVQDIQGRTPLHSAAEQGHSEAVRLLLQNSANIIAQDIQGRTPLHLAFEQDHYEIVQLLLKNGADVNGKDRDGRTLLQKAVSSMNKTMVKVLQEAGADIASKSAFEKSFLRKVALESSNLGTEARLSDVCHDYEDILNPGKYFKELNDLERRVALHSSLKYFEQGLYIIEKSHHSLDSLSSDFGLWAMRGALWEGNNQDFQAWSACYKFIMRSLVESYSVVLQVLENLDLLGESGFCGSFFTILVATRSRPEVAQVSRIERSTVDVIAVSMRESIFALAALYSRLKVDGQYYSQLPQDVSSTVEVPRRHCTELLAGMDLVVQGRLDEGSSLNMMPELTDIRLATLIMNLGLVMYSGSHGSDIEKYLRTHVIPGNQSPTMEGVGTSPILTPRESLDEVNPSRLQVLNEAATYGFQCTMKRLACLEEFIGGSVWVFEHLQTGPIATVSDRRLFVSTSIEDFSDMWGPVWAVPSKERNMIKHYNVPKGMIRRVSLNTFPDPKIDDCEIPCHWNSWAELSEYSEGLHFTFDDLLIKPSDKLLIGLPFQNNVTCQFTLREIERTRAGRMVPAGTFSEAWFTDTYQIGANAGFRGVGVSTQRTRKKRPSKTHKEAIWDNIKNSPQSFHPGIFNLLLGLEVSHCTGNARRIKMKDLFRLDPVKSYLKEVQPEWYNSALGGQFSEAISSSDAGMLRCFWDGLSAEKKLEVVAIVQVVIDPLQFTGVREDGTFGVGYLSSGRDAQIMLLNRHLNDWAGVLKDSETVTTYAILNKVCLECALRDYDTHICRSKGGRAGFTVLETQITVPYGISDQEQSRFFRLGEQGRLDIISKKDDGVLVAKWEQADMREVLNRVKKLVQPQKEILYDQEVVKDAEMGDQIFQVYIRSQHRSNFGWGEAVYGW